MDRPERDPAAGAGLGILSVARNKKVMTVLGALLMAGGAAGMIFVGARAIEMIQSGGFDDPAQGSSIQLTEYVFMFILIGGFVMVIYAQVSMQMEKAEEIQSRQERTDHETAAAA